MKCTRKIILHGDLVLIKTSSKILDWNTLRTTSSYHDVLGETKAMQRTILRFITTTVK